jgi:hypothetical protein
MDSVAYTVRFAILAAAFVMPGFGMVLWATLKEERGPGPWVKSGIAILLLIPAGWIITHCLAPGGTVFPHLLIK